MARAGTIHRLSAACVVGLLFLALGLELGHVHGLESDGEPGRTCAICRVGSAPKSVAAAPSLTGENARPAFASEIYILELAATGTFRTCLHSRAPPSFRLA